MNKSEKKKGGIIGWAANYNEAEEEQAYTLAMAMNAQGVRMDKVMALHLIETFEVVVAKGMEFSLEDAAKLEVEFENLRNEQTKLSGEAAEQQGDSKQG